MPSPATGKQAQCLMASENVVEVVGTQRGRTEASGVALVLAGAPFGGTVTQQA